MNDKGRQKHWRVCGSKVTTGCITCKKRRVKCDEAKPYCRRCTSSNRHCDGYASKQKPPPRLLHMILYHAPGSTSSFLVSEQETQSFDFFRLQTTHRFPIEFSHPVLRAAHTEEALTSAVVSLGALQQLYEYDSEIRLSSPLGQFAMKQYGRALRLLQGSLSPAVCAPEIMLICCLLFACFECIRGFRRAAVIHIKSGLNILRDCGMGEEWGRVSKQTMRCLFMRLDNQVVELLGVELSRTVGEDGLGSSTSSIQGQGSLGSGVNDVYHSLDGVLNRIFYERLDTALNLRGDGTLVLPVDQGRTSRSLEEWHRGFAASFPSTGMEVQSNVSETYGHDPDIMRMWYILGKMYVAIPPDEETPEAWDQFQGEFEMILSLGERYLSRIRQYSRRRTFSFCLGIIPPVYVVGFRCRDVSIRRRAISLLESCDRREILWDSKMAAGAIRHVIGLEEGQGRVSNVSVILDDDTGVRLEFE